MGVVVLSIIFESGCTSECRTISDEIMGRQIMLGMVKNENRIQLLFPAAADIAYPPRPSILTESNQSLSFSEFELQKIGRDILASAPQPARCKS